MYAYKYDPELEFRPWYVQDGGYYAANGLVLGFGENQDTSSLDLEYALGWALHVTKYGADGSELTQQQRIDQISAHFTTLGFTVTSTNETNMVTEATNILFEEVVRPQRDVLLTACDWTQLPDVSSNNVLTSQQISDYVTYRQNLRDITDTYSTATHISEITWPTEPTI